MAHNGNKLSGKLELNWVNKNKTLIVEDYDKGQYEWVEPNDYRVSEVRLLKEMEKVGNNSSDNLIICGDSLHALTSLSKIPEYRQKYVNKVKLIYIDPPFNTGQMFANYDDQLEHSVWLTMMRDRVLKAHELLSDDGSLWVHLDDTELYHFKLVLDEIFGKENFISSVVWEKMYLLKEDAKQFSQGHDTMLVYSKDKEKWRPNFLEKKLNLEDFKFQDEKGRHYKRVTLRKTGSNSARADRPNMFYPIIAPNGEKIYPLRRPARGVEDEGRWRWGVLTYEKRKDEIDWVKGKNGWQPFVKQYADETETKPPSSIWHYEEVGSSATAKKEKEAVQAFLNHYWNSENNAEKLSEYILSVATGVGKTYIIADILNYLAEAEKVTNFLIVAPGKIIREKTINNFSLNKPNSLADKLTIKPPHIIDIKNFHTVKTEDKNSVKLFIFTVQSLTQAKGKTARKTSNYDEVLGKSLREHLSKLDDLVIFADEHHLYYGEKFSEAIRELKPKILIGLTGTPHKKTPAKEIIFEYPLWKALRDKLIKIPVMVGRYDGYQEEETKLKDAIKLLEAKQILLDNYTQQNNLNSQKALMLAIAPSIEEAENIRTSLIVNCEFPQENILQVDSSKITDDLAQELQNIDNPQSPTRIIIAVGMLKEGWDVKNVYVIVPLRAFKSPTFIEQIIGRGLRLPFGNHTSKEALNTLEIIMHDNFQELLNVRKSLKNKFFGLTGEENIDSGGYPKNDPDNSVSQPPEENNSNQNIFNPQNLDEREKEILQESKEVVPPNRIKEKFAIKILRQKIQSQNFSLKIIEIKGLGKRFKELGENFSSQKEIKNLLQRYKIEIDPQQKISWRTTEDEEFTIEATQQLPEEEKIKRKLIQIIFRKCSFINSANSIEIDSANRLVDKFLQASNLEIVSQYWEAAGEQLAKLIQTIFKELHVGENQPEQEVIEKYFGYSRPSCEVVAKNLEEEFVKRTKGFKFNKSLYNYDTFDSSIEFQFAGLIDKTKEVKKWIRLLQWGDEIYILYGKSQRHYFPDFLVIDENDIHWIVEIKDDNNPNPEIDEKNQAAKEWVNVLNLDLGEEERKNEKWRFLYITKGNMSKSHENWNMLKEICRV